MHIDQTKASYVKSRVSSRSRYRNVSSHLDVATLKSHLGLEAPCLALTSVRCKREMHCTQKLLYRVDHDDGHILNAIFLDYINIIDC